MARWTALIEPYASSLERDDTQQTYQPVGLGGHISVMPSNGRGRPIETTGLELSVDEIIAELDALSIRRKKLRSMLPYAYLFEDGSARTSPAQNTAHLVNQTQLSESESSRAGQGQRRGSPSSPDGRKRVFGRGRQGGAGEAGGASGI